MKNVIDCLEERGFIDAVTSEEIRIQFQKPTKVYIGFDPTADSLHLGSLMGIIALAWFQKFNHVPVVILGGSTGRIGDPSGKSIERPLLDQATISSNIERIRCHFEQILDFSKADAKPLILNNDEWFSKFFLVDFLRDVGKHFRIGTMLGKESVRARLNSEEGMSFTEFSYQLLQAYDFYFLHKTKDICVQVGGSDQWGNIVAGIELIRKLSAAPAFGMTFPLLTRSDGKKFGKTEEGAVWLAADRFSPYQFYQYLVRIPDADVIKMMRLLTFMDMEEIRTYEKKMALKDYVPNTAQRRLAEEITRIVHGESGLESALRATAAAAPGAASSLDPKMLKDIAHDMPSIILNLKEVIDQKIVDLIVKMGLLSSKGETVRLIGNGGAYLNNEKIEDVNLRISEEHLIGGEYLLIGVGKKKKMLVNVER